MFGCHKSNFLDLLRESLTLSGGLEGKGMS